MILLLLSERQEERPRSLGRMLLALALVGLLYKIGPAILGFLVLLVSEGKDALKPAIPHISTLLGYLFGALLLCIDLFVAYALLRGWKSSDTRREKWAAVLVGFSAVAAVIAFMLLLLQNDGAGGSTVLAFLLFGTGIKCMPKPKPQVSEGARSGPMES